MLKTLVFFIAIVALSSGFANTLSLFNSISNSGLLIFDSAYADNTVNQTTSNNEECDLSSFCISSGDQSSLIQIGDRNRINQNMQQDNNDCNDASSCENFDLQGTSIGQTTDGFISDSGSRNENLQPVDNSLDSANDNSIVQNTDEENSRCNHQAFCSNSGGTRSVIGINDNRIIVNTGDDNKNTQSGVKVASTYSNSISHKVNQLNEDCQNEAFCENIELDESFLGNVLNEAIFNGGNNNINLQNIVQSDSDNENTISTVMDQKNRECKVVCHNEILDISGSLVSGPGILNIGNNNTNIQSVIELGSDNKNTIIKDLKQENENCDSCDNVGANLNFIGGSFHTNNGPNVYNDENNNVNTQNISQVDSSTHNSITSDQSQVNNDCQHGSGCRNSDIQVTSLGVLVPSGFIANDGENSTVSEDISAANSDNGNTINTRIAQKNNRCDNQSACLNDFSSSILMNENPLEDISPGNIFNVGNNNSISKSVSNVESKNNNEFEQITTQENSDCNELSICRNFLTINVNLGLGMNNDLHVQGNNSNVSSTVSTFNSNNNNEINQEADQTNHHCSANSSCTNFAAVSSLIGLVNKDEIVSDTSNSKIVESILVDNTNNDNTILQQIRQNNFCREDSECSNAGNLISEVNEQNNQQIDQTLTQKNLCLKESTCNNVGKVTGASGSNSQFNICIKDSDCSNSGTNNKSVCLDGSSCINSGTNTKVISKDSSCSSGVDGSTTICSSGRIISVGKDPELRT